MAMVLSNLPLKYLYLHSYFVCITVEFALLDHKLSKTHGGNARILQCGLPKETPRILHYIMNYISTKL